MRYHSHMFSQAARVRAVIGWREWVTLPAIGVTGLEVKVDTGARTSALHAFDLTTTTVDGRPWLRFAVHPRRESTAEGTLVHAPLLDERMVKNSGGVAELRPVIATELALGGHVWRVEITLTDRDEMGFRMLLGREALQGRFVVDPGRSWTLGRPGRPARKPRLVLV
jgi:hypothetical protein